MAKNLKNVPSQYFLGNDELRKILFFNNLSDCNLVIYFLHIP